MVYSYGPPPPAPAPAPAAGGYGHQYPPPPQHQYQHQASRGGHTPRGGRGGHHGGGRPNYTAPAPAPYGYNGQHQQQPTPSYGPQNPAQYPPQHPQAGGYPQQPPQPQQWPDQTHGQHPQHQQHPQPGHPQHPPPHAPLQVQNYHPNYAQHIYQSPQPAYGQQQPPQPAYGPPAPQQPPQQPYAQPYPPQQPPNGPPAQQWGGPTPSHHPQSQPHQTHQPHIPQFGGGRGRGGHHNDHGPPKAQVMGPPIRMGFDNGVSQSHTAPVSNAYPPQPYGAPPGPGPYPPAPYQGYPSSAASPMSGPAPPYDHRFQQQNGHHRGRGGFQNNNFRQRPQFGDHKSRHHNNNNNHNGNNNNRKGGGPPSTVQTHNQKPDAPSAGKKKKRKTNTLGLTPGDESEEDDHDEEARLTELIGADALQPQDMVLWLAERRRRFPTQARVQAKLAAQSDQNGVKIKKEDKDTKDAHALALEKQQQKADKLRRELEKVESSLKRKREQQDAGDEMRNIDASSSVSSSPKSEDEKPETMSSKRDNKASHLPPPPRKADPTKHCKYYSTGGTCGKKGKCRFVHDPKVREAALKAREMNGGRMTLQQRLVLNDKDQEDLTIIKTLQYLREKGLVQEDKSASNGASTNGQAPKSQLPPPPASGLPPQPPPSALSNTPYQGWNLRGFGNTGVKDDN